MSLALIDEFDFHRGDVAAGFIHVWVAQVDRVGGAATFAWEGEDVLNAVLSGFVEGGDEVFVGGDDELLLVVLMR